MMVDVPIKINPQEIQGNWKGGWTLDEHTVSSSVIPGGGFDTVRTELGSLVFKLKYRQDRSKILTIAELAASFIRQRPASRHLNAIIPIPPSNTDREFQPVFEVAIKIGEILRLPVPFDYLVKSQLTAQIKNEKDVETKKRILQEAMQVQDQSYEGKYILLFDDLYDSGATLMAATDVLLNQGKVKRVSVLTLTRTRTKNDY